MAWSKDIVAVLAVLGGAEGLVSAFGWPGTVAAVVGGAFTLGIAFARIYVARVGADNTRVDEMLDAAEDGVIEITKNVEREKKS